MGKNFLFVFVLAFAQAKGQEGKPAVPRTPPMGWNSYDCYGETVTEAEVKANADYVAKNLKPYGWDYIVIDYCWFYEPIPGSKIPPMQQVRLADGSYSPRLAMDQFGRLLPVTSKFPSARGGKGFKPLADYVHSLGLKFGIHIMRGIPRQAVGAKTPVFRTKDMDASMAADTLSTCTWLDFMYGLDMDKPGAQAYLNSIVRLYADWGVDFIKVDDISSPYHAAEIEGYAKAIKNSGRRIVLSLSPGETPVSEADHVIKYANQWRLAGDFWDNWPALKHMFDLGAKWASYAGPGHWPDFDMIPIGKLSKRGPDGEERYSHFTDAEKQSLMTLWCIARAPLILGGNLPENTTEEMALETNAEVLAVNQKGLDSKQLYRKDDLVVWVSHMPGNKVWNVALFNLNDEPREVRLSFSDLGINGQAAVHDLWQKKELGNFKSGYGQLVEAHGSA
jgi:alpha-galactosidase